MIQKSIYHLILSFHFPGSKNTALHLLLFNTHRQAMGQRCLPQQPGMKMLFFIFTILAMMQLDHVKGAGFQSNCLSGYQSGGYPHLVIYWNYCIIVRVFIHLKVHCQQMFIKIDLYRTLALIHSSHKKLFWASLRQEAHDVWSNLYAATNLPTKALIFQIKIIFYSCSSLLQYLTKN